MSEVYYTDALKLAQKEYRACLSRGTSPFLPVMDDFVPEEKALAGGDPVGYLAELLQNSIRTGVSEPFRGPLYSQDGKVLEAERSLTPDQIINMDWLLENVVGSIPEYNELSEIGKATVDMVGISRVFKDGRG